MDTNTTTRVLLRPEDVAQALQIGRTKVFELIRTGELRSIKLGGSRRITSAALAEYVARLDGGATDGVA